MAGYGKPRSTLCTEIRGVEEAIRDHRQDYLAKPKNGGGRRKDSNHWTLKLKGDPTKRASGFGQKWAEYLDAWRQLEPER